MADNLRGVPSRGWISGTQATVRRWVDHPRASQFLLGTAMALLVYLGLMMVLSASSVLSYSQNDGNSYAIFLRQLFYTVVGLLAAAGVAVLPPERTRWMGFLLLGLSLLGLLLTFTGLGMEVNGNRNWLVIGPLRGQPSEFAKLAMVWWGAWALARHESELDQLRRLVKPYLVVCGILVGLVVIQGDLGSAIIMMAICVGVLWVAGVPLKVFAGFAGLGTVAILGLVAAAPYRMQRLLTLVQPAEGVTSENYQSMMGTYALASGGWWGRGLGGSSQKWGGLPEAHTDYILAVIGEELGLFGTLAVILMYGLLGWAGVRIMSRSIRPFQRYLAAGVTTWIVVQAFINIAVVLGMWPVMGVTLPFISYGGSSVVATLIAVGLLFACARTEPAALADNARRARARDHQHATARVSAVVDGRTAAGSTSSEGRETVRAGGRTKGTRTSR